MLVFKRKMLVKTFNLLFVLFFFLAIAAYSDLNLPPLSAQAYSSSSQQQNVPVPTLLWRTPVYMITNQYLSVALHEGSHALAAMLMGYQIESIDIGFRQGEVKYKDADNMNDFQNIVASLAGPFANRYMAVAVNSYLDTNENNMDENVRSFLGTTYIWNRGNFAYYLFRSFFVAVFYGDFVSDWGTVAYLCSGKNFDIAYFVMGGFAALEVWDLYSTRAEVSKNFDRMIGRFPDTASASSAKAQTSSFSVLPYNDGFIAVQQFPF